MNILILVCYIIFSCIDSYASEHSKSRICKIFLIPLLILLLVINKYGNIIFYLALVFCWIGDLLLIHKTKRNQLVGTLSFLCGHVFYIVCFIDTDHFQNVISYAAYIPYLVSIILYLYYTYALIPRKFMPVAFIYMLVITGMSYAAFLHVIFSFSFWTCITWCGTVSFLISDTFISRQMFLHKKQKWVMETYALAQLLMVTGVVYGTGI